MERRLEIDKVLTFSLVLILLLFSTLVSYDPIYGVILFLFLLVISCITKLNIMLSLFLLFSVGLGPYYNLAFRYGNITISDMFLFLLAVSLFLNFQIKQLKYFYFKSFTLVPIFLILISTLIGIMSRNDLMNIIQDLKLAGYFIIPFASIVILYKKKESGFSKELMIILIVCSIIVCIQEIFHINQVGLQTMLNNNFSNRNVGLSVQIVPIGSMLVFLLKFKNKISMSLFLFLQFLFLSGILLSFTRTIWIQYILTLLLMTMSVSALKNKKYLIRLNFGLFFLSFIIILLFFLPSNSIVFTNLKILIMERLDNLLNSSSNQVNTFEIRMEESFFLLKYLEGLGIIFGKGLGDVFFNPKIGSFYVFVENSIFYYWWKYGIVSVLLILFSILVSAKKLFKSNNDYYKWFALSILCFIVVGNFSGNLNLYYFMPILSVFFGLSVLNINENNEVQI